MKALESHPLTMRKSRSPYSWTAVRLPDRELSDSVLDFAAPLLERLGDAPAPDAVRGVVALAIEVRNALVLVGSGNSCR